MVNDKNVAGHKVSTWYLVVNFLDMYPQMGLLKQNSAFKMRKNHHPLSHGGRTNLCSQEQGRHLSFIQLLAGR